MPKSPSCEARADPVPPINLPHRILGKGRSVLDRARGRKTSEFFLAARCSRKHSTEMGLVEAVSEKIGKGGSPPVCRQGLARLRRNACFQGLVVLALFLFSGACYREVRTRNECEEILLGLLAFQTLATESIQTNPDFTESERERRLESISGFPLVAVNIYNDCISHVPANSWNPFEVL